MQLGVDVGTSRLRACWASTLLGAGPADWAPHNHRTLETPAWISIRLGESGVLGAESAVCVGHDALSVCQEPSFVEEWQRGRSVAWPRFPRDAQLHPENFAEAIYLLWDRWLKPMVADQKRCSRVILTASPVRERLLAQALAGFSTSIPVTTIPDYFAAYLSVEPPSGAEERVLHIDCGAEAFRFTLFRTWREGRESWVMLEEMSELRELGRQNLAAAACLPVGEARSEGVPGLSFWQAMEEQETIGADKDEGVPPAVRVGLDRASSRVEALLDRLSGSGRLPDLVLVNPDAGLRLSGDLPCPIKTLDRFAPARGAALVGQDVTESVHVFCPGALFLLIEGRAPILLVRSEDLSCIGHSGAEFGDRYPRAQTEEIDAQLAWGPTEGAGQYLPLGSLRLATGMTTAEVAIGCSVQRRGHLLFGDLWALDPLAEKQESAPWSLDLSQWSYWTAK